MLIIGCDYHPSFQQIAFVDTDTGELQERRLEHREEAEKFYRDLAATGTKAGGPLKPAFGLSGDVHCPHSKRNLRPGLIPLEKTTACRFPPVPRT